MNVGQRIKEEREELGMQRTVLARRLGVSPTSVYRWESGEREPSMAMLEKIAHELRVEPSDFLRPKAAAAPTYLGRVETTEEPAGEGRAIRANITSTADAKDKVMVLIDIGEFHELLRAKGFDEATTSTIIGVAKNAHALAGQQ